MTEIRKSPSGAREDVGGGPTPPANYLIAVFGNPLNGTINAGQFLAPQVTEPHALEPRCLWFIPDFYTITTLVLHADTNGGVTGLTRVTLKVNGGVVAIVELNIGQNDVVVTTGFDVDAAQKFSAELTLAPDAFTSSYALGIYGHSRTP